MQAVLLILSVVTLVTAKPNPEAKPEAKPQYDLPIDQFYTPQIQPSWDVPTYPRSGYGGSYATGYPGYYPQSYGGQPMYRGQYNLYGGQSPWYGGQLPWYGGPQPYNIEGTQTEWNKKSIEKSIKQLQTMLDDLKKDTESEDNTKKDTN